MDCKNQVSDLNRFSVLASLYTEENLELGEGHLQARAQRSCTDIVEDALNVRNNLKNMMRDESMDKDFVIFLRSETKSFSAELLRFDKHPEPFNP
ncbi:hypothetical protein U1Q18_049238, partial [Sarracenia purpurea var. burkii]